MVKVNGLWVHRAVAEPGADWKRALGNGREERIGSVLKAYHRVEMFFQKHFAEGLGACCHSSSFMTTATI